MQFDLTDEQALLKATLDQFLASRHDFRERTAASRRDPGFQPAIWRAFADELGLLGIAAPAELGGLGGGATEQMVVMEALGAHLCLEPVAETVFGAGWLLAQGGPAARAIVTRIVAGEVIATVAVEEPRTGGDLAAIATRAERQGEDWLLSGTKAVVSAAPWAQVLVVAARAEQGITLFAVPADAPGLSMQAYPTIDERRAADVTLDRVCVPGDMVIGAVGGGLALLETWRDRAIAAQAAEAAGLLGRLVEDTVAYARQREQFGQPIAAFQALQHRMVDMHIEAELVRAAAVLAACRLEAPPAERARAASSAKIAVTRACRMVGQNAVQLHGGMGMTDELPIGHYFKRATRMESEHGSESWHLARLARLTA